MEKYTIKHADNVIICEPEREEQIPFPILDEKLSILPNIPFFTDSSFLQEREDYMFNNDKLTFSYVGGFYDERCIMEIIELAAKGYINLLIAGFGDKSYVDRLKELESCPNIKYFGKVSYNEALNIMYNSDIIYAMYAISNPNHIYAAPNKFYESMFLGKPIFTTIGTIVGEKVNMADRGYISGESLDDILDVIQNIDISKIKIKGNNAKILWESKYKFYTQDFMTHKYKVMTQFTHEE